MKGKLFVKVRKCTAKREKNDENELMYVGLFISKINFLKCVVIPLVFKWIFDTFSQSLVSLTKIQI